MGWHITYSNIFYDTKTKYYTTFFFSLRKHCETLSKKCHNITVTLRLMTLLNHLTFYRGNFSNYNWAKRLTEIKYQHSMLSRYWLPMEKLSFLFFDIFKLRSRKQRVTFTGASLYFEKNQFENGILKTFFSYCFTYGRAK